MIITRLNLYRYQIPLSKLLPVGRQRIAIKQGLVLRATTSNTHGEVEIAPLSGLDIRGQQLQGFSHESLDEVCDALSILFPLLRQQPIDRLLEFAEKSPLPSLAYGLSLLHARLSGSLAHCRHHNQTIPLIYHDQNEPMTQVEQRILCLPENLHAVKIKIGHTSIEDEIRLIFRLLKARPQIKLKLDANRQFELQQAIDFFACLPIESIEYVEEPCQNPDDNSRLFTTLGIPYALDESLNQPNYQFTMTPGLTALVIKPMLTGSLAQLKNLIDTARINGVRSILSSSLEASLGIAAIRDLGGKFTPNEPLGIDTLAAFKTDLIVSSGKTSCLNYDDLSSLNATK